MHSHLSALDEDDLFGNALATVLDYAAERQEQQMRAAAALVAVLEAENARLREASGYWRSEDREFGYPDLNELLDGYEQGEIIQITPWRDLPDGFAAWTEEQDWVFYDTEAEARAAIAAAKGA
jgi:alkylated DNA repair dioxygenase AlkB